MKILYIARHKPNYRNDDEGAIASAFESLGHEVVRIHEDSRHELTQDEIEEVDFLLFHHIISTSKFDHLDIPKCFWYFDLVYYESEGSLGQRSKSRRQWMKRSIPKVLVGFCTDGDWVDQDKSGKLVLLRQGADDRIADNVSNTSPKNIDILFSGGMTLHGPNRTNWSRMMKHAYGKRFRVVRDTYREQLRELISKTRIVIAPGFPVTDRYWSNRVYLSMGFGALMLHPYANDLAKEYVEDKEIILYRDAKDMHRKIQHYVNNPEERLEVQAEGFGRTMRDHLYTHRCARMIEIIKERLS